MLQNCFMSYDNNHTTAAKQVTCNNSTKNDSELLLATVSVMLT